MLADSENYRVGSKDKDEAEPQSDWLASAWAELPERSQAMFVARCRGMKLREIGDTYAFTRERARQVLGKVMRHICDRADEALPDWRERISGSGNEIASLREDLARAIEVRNHPAVEILAEAAGLRPPRTWAGHLKGWWSSSPNALDTSLAEIASKAPFRSQMVKSLATEYGIPHSLPLEAILASDRSPLVYSQDGVWLRRRARSRDAAYLWLLEQGAPHRVELIASAVDAANSHALAESLRRDERFVQIRPEGSWALAEWPGIIGTQYRRAEDAVIDLVSQFGPISKSELFAKVIQVYPVSTWRLEQCLLIDQIGETSNGLIDLVARGARHTEVAEPAKPSNMATNDDGTVYGIRLTVDNDMLRGSGVLVNPWLTWRLGLRRAPTLMSFDTEDLPGSLVVRRNTSGAQLSSLRTFVAQHGLVLGCEVAVVLLTETLVARIRHACAVEKCPAVAPVTTDRRSV
ncbi:hypothetical protein [Nocardia asiatica]|uniref:hypothetical protein n=1 Tax=Nocardia asiatica TaxID=209252 RepID=UPI003EE149FF